ncbi:MAG: tetratricopeptide repeat protein [marine benthic group bacterium]|nr:tetratricopeptide repeat protein [Candidatus Carthagonibacter metallireducens]
MSEAPGYQRFFAELKRRKVFRVAAVYGATGFVVLQVADLLAEGMELPSVVLKTATFLVLLGFPIAMVLAWALELTPDGVRRTDPAEAGEIDEIVAQPRGKRWPAGLLALLGMIALVAGAWWAGRSTAPGLDAGPAASAASSANSDGRGAEVLKLAYADLEADARPSLAVLPFVDMIGDEEQEFFADGMTEELLNALAKIRDIRVGGRTSSFAYKGQDRDLREIGAELGVQYLVEGSVRKQGDRLRITAQLVDATDNFHLWSESYDRTIDDVFAVQEEIAGAIADELQVSLGLEDGTRLVAPTGDLDAYDLYLTGRARMRVRGDGVQEAVQLFEAAVAKDSGWAPAWAGLAQAQSLVPFYWEGSPNMRDVAGGEEGEPDRVSASRRAEDAAIWEASLAAAERAALRALEIDPTNASAEVALGNVYRDRWEWEKAEDRYLRALAIDPDDVEAHQQYAEYLAGIGRLDEALRSARRAVALDPTSAIRLNALGYILGMNGRSEEALPVYELGRAHGGDFPAIRRGIMFALYRLREFDRLEAFVLEEAARQDSVRGTRTAAEIEEFRLQTEEKFDAIRSGDMDGLIRCCESVITVRDLLAVGDTARAFERYEEAILSGPRFNGNLLNGLWIPAFDKFRSDSRFAALLEYTGLQGAELRRAPPGS